MRRSTVGLALMSALLAAGCGTTVPVTRQVAGPAGQDLQSGSGPAGSTTAPGGATASTTGAAGAVPGSPGAATSGAGSTGAVSNQPGRQPGQQPGNPATGADRVTTPILLGYMGSSSPAGVNAALGTSGGTQETPQDALAYLVRQLNGHGGLAGRSIKMVSAFIDPTSSNYETQAEAACATFTQDNHVAAVLAQEDFYYSENFSSCLTKVHVPEIEAITGGVDSATLSKYPLLYSVSAPTVERRFTAMIKGLADKGFLTKANHIGIVVEDCPYNLRAYDKAVGPAFSSRGLTVTKRTISCVHGFSDAASGIAAFQNAVLPFAAAKVDRVMFMSGFESIGLQYFEQQANQQGYHPSYALTSTADAGENNAKLSDSALQRIQGVGWEPDLDSLKLLANSSATQRCRRLFKGYTPAASRSNNRYNEMLCELFFSYEAMLLKTNGRSDAQSISAAGSGLGASYVSPLALDGATEYGPGDKDGPKLFGTFGYLKGCRCIGYTGPPRPLA